MNPTPRASLFEPGGLLPDGFWRDLVQQLKLAVVVYRGAQRVFANDAARGLAQRLAREQGIALEAVLLDHLLPLRDGRPSVVPTVTLLTASNGEPFYLNVIPLGDSDFVAISVRELGVEVDAVRTRYGLSRREAQVAELVLRGYGNREIAGTLGIATGTAKKHLTRIFDKVGVDSRAQLASRLA